MLYNPNWTKADPLTLDALIAWLETKPATRRYCYSDRGHCLAAQYNASIGRKYRVTSLFRPVDNFDFKLEYIAVQVPSTFGAALARARAMLAEQS